MYQIIKFFSVLSLAFRVSCFGGLLGQERGEVINRFPETALAYDQLPEELVLKDGERVFARFSWKDEGCKRPFFYDFSAPDGTALTRNYPPKEGVDSTDHSTMHGGIWLAFGDINGEDFWRNRGSIVQKEFIKMPEVSNGRIEYQTRSIFVDREQRKLGESVQTFRVVRMDGVYGLYWGAEMRAAGEIAGGVLAFGDQEEMGLGVRLATPLIEKNGGEILNSEGLERAQGTWGKSARWVDYSRQVEGKRVGVTLIPLVDNPRESWFHNRDYGLMVANLFGRKSLTGGEQSLMEVRSPRAIRIEYVVLGYAVSASEFGVDVNGRRIAIEEMVKRFTDRLTDRSMVGCCENRD
jgi:hypothetical protein